MLVIWMDEVLALPKLSLFPILLCCFCMFAQWFCTLAYSMYVLISIVLSRLFDLGMLVHI